MSEPSTGARRLSLSDAMLRLVSASMAFCVMSASFRAMPWLAVRQASRNLPMVSERAREVVPWARLMAATLAKSIMDMKNFLRNISF